MISDQLIKTLMGGPYLGIIPYEPNNVQPASIDVRLGTEFRIFKTGPSFVSKHSIIDTKSLSQDLTKSVNIPFGERLQIEPGQFMLGCTYERVRLSGRLYARLEGKSSLGRLGLIVHVTAGYIDPGFEGEITLELYNMNSVPIILYPGMKVAQLSIDFVTGVVENPYGSTCLGSKYQYQEGATASKYDENFREEKED